MSTVESRPCVLVVDGHRFSRTVIVRILEAARYRVEEVEHASAALAWLEDHTPDAFVLDADLPGMDGIELCWRLREDPRFRTTPILVATVDEDRYLLRAAFTAGCDDFLVKPLEPLVVVARIGGLLKKAEYYRELEAIRSELARYVSPRIRTLVERQVSVGGASEPALMHACILFSDIRGFTAMSRSIEPKRLFATLSTHLGAQVDCVYAHRGYVDKFGGDGLMAVFDGETMATDACRCALEMMSRVAREASSSGPVPTGIGIHSGSVVIGNIGTGEHLDHTAIGENVNIAARLCGQAGSGDIIVSESVRRQVGERADLAFGEPLVAPIRGLVVPMTLYQLRRGTAA